MHNECDPNIADHYQVHPTVNPALCTEVSGNLVRVSEKMVSCKFLDTLNLCQASTLPLILNPAFQGEFNSQGSD